jgi:hypothetical protein
MTVNSPTIGSRRQDSPAIDSRGPRFGAAITTVVLAVVLVTAGSWHAFAGWLLFAQTLVFAIGAVAGLRYAPYGLIFRHLVRPRLGPPAKSRVSQRGLRLLPRLPHVPVYPKDPSGRLRRPYKEVSHT